MQPLPPPAPPGNADLGYLAGLINSYDNLERTNAVPGIQNVEIAGTMETSNPGGYTMNYVVSHLDQSKTFLAKVCADTLPRTPLRCLGPGYSSIFALLEAGRRMLLLQREY